MGHRSQVVDAIIDDHSSQMKLTIVQTIRTAEQEIEHLENITNFLMNKLVNELDDKRFAEMCRKQDSFKWFFERNASFSSAELKFQSKNMIVEDQT